MNSEPCLCTGLRQAAHAATEIYDRALEPSGLKITMFRVLRRLSEVDEPTISELARIVDLDRSSLGRNLKVLERQNLVRLTEGKDERSKVVRLTHKGSAALEKAMPLWAKAQARMKIVLGSNKTTVFDVLAKVNQEMQAI
jgi:DNA-binding MarR family transcriptional regulator